MSKAHGLLLVYTGDGKGKTTAALGILFRALGRGMKCGVVQFLKGKWETGEKLFAKSLPQLDFHIMGLGFTWDSDDLDKDKAAAKAAWEKAATMLRDENYKIIVLDEIMYAFHYGWLSVEEVLAVLQARPKEQHVILTGRRCPPAILETADLVSSMENIKHPYKSGIPAQLGIDF